MGSEIATKNLTNLVTEPPVTVEVDQLTKVFHKLTAVNKISFNVTPGVIHGFVGPNGAGKTTTIKILIGAMLASKGKAFIEGHKSGSVEANTHLGYIPENARFPRNVNALNYLVMMANISGIKTKNAKEIAIKTLKDIGLWDFRKQKPYSFSSGMKKKILLAQALVHNPTVLIMDEPAANLDPSARIELFNTLKKLREQGKTIFISSHILTELQGLIDEITIINHGKIVYFGKLTNVNEHYYAVQSNNNDKFKKLLIANGFKIKTSDHVSEFLISINQPDDSFKIMEIALKAKILITNFRNYEVDLQQLYQSVIANA